MVKMMVVKIMIMVTQPVTVLETLFKPLLQAHTNTVSVRSKI